MFDYLYKEELQLQSINFNTLKTEFNVNNI